MKRFLCTVTLMGLLVVFMEPAGKLLSSFLRLDQPTLYEIQEGDWLSKIAERYYGDASYWKELGLINRSPDGDRIYPGEKLIVLSFEAIQKIRTSRSLTVINEIVNLQQDLLAGRIDRQTAPVAAGRDEMAVTLGHEPGTREESPEILLSEANLELSPEAAADESTIIFGTVAQAETPSFLSTAAVTGITVLVVILLMGILMYLREKKRDEEISYYGDSSDKEAEKLEESGNEKSVYYFDDFRKEYLKSSNGHNGKEEVMMD